MGFYGNITDTSHIHFQFDKIFPNRLAMDEALQYGTDGIFAGRFVLVKYNPEGEYPFYKFFQGYKNFEDNNNYLYQDRLFQHPFIYTTFTEVLFPRVEDWEQYYIYVNNKYIALQNIESFDDNETYYIPAVSDNDNIVGPNDIIQLKSLITGELTKEFYRCTAAINEGRFGEPALWEAIIEDEHYGNYFINYNIDAAAYGTSFDSRGYDATVWQKVYSEGQGKFVLIAHLNGGYIPSFELFANAPSSYPEAPYIDSKSTDALYRIHVPSQWGFRIKEADLSDSGGYPLSDQRISQEYKEYDDDNNVIRTYQNEIYADIYFNKKANNKLYDYTDQTQANQIILEPTGISGKHYWNSDDESTDADIYELSIHLPMIGNMVAEGYNLIYGTSEDQENHKRTTDIEWYNGTASDELKYNGNTALGGKTHSLNTLAGSLNTIHDIMGQIVVPLESWPNEEGIEALSDQYLYTFNNNYYRKGTILKKRIIPDNEYTFTIQNNVSENDFILNKYYYQSDNTWIPATTWDSNLSNSGYALRNINTARYSPVPLLIQFSPGQYYIKEGENYWCDNALTIPTYPNRTYYQVNASLAGSNQDGHFTGEYVSDGRYFTKDEKGNYIPSHTDTQLINTTYYGVTVHNTYTNRRFYHPGSFYYKEGDSFYLEEDSSPHNDRSYYVLIFSDTPKYGYGADGQVIQYYEIAYEPEPVFSFSTMPVDSSELYVLQDGEYIAYDNIGDLDTILHRNPYTIPRTYYTLNVVSYAGDLYLPGVYYIKNNNNSYYRSYDSLDISETYYIIDSATPLETPFYLPDKYYYQVSTDVYELARTDTMTQNGTSYYTKSPLYVNDDTTGICPYGYEWNDYAAYIPPSISLYSATRRADLIPLPTLGKETNSLFGLLLRLNILYGPGEDENRDINTIRGIYNKLQDLLYQIKTLRPGQILYVNDFGQIDSITLSKLKTLLANV